jgi:hypothetical protein
MDKRRGFILCEEEKNAAHSLEKDPLKKYLKYAFGELQKEIEEEQVRRILSPVLEKIRGKTTL